MVITYHGGAFIRAVFGDTTIAVNPIAKDSRLKATRFGADIALVCLNHPDFNGIEQVTHGEKTPFVINGPGGYEVRKVVISGFPSVSKYGGGEHINTIYSVLFENMNLCFLGALSSRKIDGETKEALGNIDILFVPIGGGDVLNAAAAHELAVELEAKIIIPTLFGLFGEKGGKQLSTFLKEEGTKNGKPIDKLTIKKKDLEGKEGNIIVLA